MKSFETLLTEQIPRLRRYARALTRDRSGADDLVQDCLERAWRRADYWRKGSDLRAWLFTIMHNLFVNQVRGRAAAVMVSIEEVEGGEQTVPADDASARDLDAGLTALPLEQREVLLLVALEGMRYEEVAEILGIPIGTVMSRLHRARTSLRASLAGEPAPRLRRVK